MNTRSTWWIVLGITALVIAVPALMLAPETEAYPRYELDDSLEPPLSGYCATCHGNFTDGTSPGGNSIPGNNKHSMHRDPPLDAQCDQCHTNGDSRNPYMNSSNGASTTGYGCIGCHGRLEDGGNDAISTGYGAGLRQHHWNAGQTTCGQGGCHTDADPSSYTPVGEDVFPPYYGVSADSAADEPCNPTATAGINENYTTGDFEGLDNDGDDVYDTNDSDCIDATPGEVSKPGILNPMLVTGHSGGVLSISYDPACLTTENKIEYGDLADLSTYTYAGQECTIGTSGTYDWTYPASPGSFFFLIVGHDATEGDYGRDRDNGPTPPLPPATENLRPHDTTNTSCQFADGGNSCN